MKKMKHISGVIFMSLLLTQSSVFAGSSKQSLKEKVGDFWQDVKALPGEIAQTAKEEYLLYKKKGFKQYSRDMVADSKKQAEAYWKLFKKELPFEWSSAQKKIEAAWLSIAKAPVAEGIQNSSRADTIRSFLQAAEVGNIHNTLIYLFGGKLTIFDETIAGNNLLTVLMSEYNQTPIKEKSKKTLLIFAMYKLLLQSGEIVGEEIDQDDYEKKTKILEQAMQDFQSIITQEVVAKKLKN